MKRYQLGKYPIFLFTTSDFDHSFTDELLPGTKFVVLESIGTHRQRILAGTTTGWICMRTDQLAALELK
jgi:hypothetical protein